MVDKHKEYLNQVQFSAVANDYVEYVKAAACAIHKGVFSPDGKRCNPKHNMFVDNNLMTKIRQYIQLDMEASIEALFCLLGYPDPDLRKSPLCMEKSS